MAKLFWTIFLSLLFIASSLFILFDYGPVVQVSILQYEGVNLESNEETKWIRARNFLQQLDYIEKEQINVVPLDAIVDLYRSGQKIPPKTIALTFDGTHEYYYSTVYSALKKHEMPATFFIVSEQIDQEGYLTEKNVEEMAKNERITIGCHGQKPDLNFAKLSSQDVYAQAYFSKNNISSLIFESVDFISYPKGKFSAQAAGVIKKIGFKAAFASYRKDRTLREKRNLYYLERVPIVYKDKHLLHFRLKCWGNYSLCKAWWDKISSYF